MKKNIWGGWRRTGVSGAGVAAAMCLTVLGVWGNANAQITKNADGYTVSHTTTNNGLSSSDWTTGGDRGNWSVTTVSEKTGAFAPDKVSKESFLTLNTAAYKCSNDGNYTVRLGMINQVDGGNGGPWALRGAAAVFRYTSTKKFYAVRLVWNYNNAYKVIFAVDTLTDAENPISAETNLGTISDTAGAEITMRIELRGDTIRVYPSATSTALVGQVIKTNNPGGQVGYAHSVQHDRGAVFYGSSWKDSNPPAVAVPTGYMAWNPKKDSIPNLTAGSGAWADPFWTSTDASSQVAWVANSNAYFAGKGPANGAYTVSAASQSVGNIRFGTTGYTISGAGPLTRATNGGVFVESGKNATISAVLAGAAGFTKDSAGILTLSGANTYTGASTVRAGTLTVANDAALSAGGVTVSGGATLQLNGGIALANALTVTGGTAGGITSAGSANALSGTVTLSGTTAVPVTVTKNLTVGGIISGTAGIAKGGPDTLILTGVNTYTGTTTVSAGSLRLGDGGAGSVAGAIALTGTGSQVIFNNGANNVSYTGVISGAGGLTKRGAGTLTVPSTTTNTYTGATAIEAGTVAISSPVGIGSGAGGVTISTGATLRLGSSTSGSATTLSKAVSGGGAFTKESASKGTLNLGAAVNVAKFNIEGGTVVAAATAAITSDSIKVSGTAGTSSDAARLSVAANLGSSTNPSKIVINAYGTLSDSGAFTYTGSVNINGGTLEHKGTKALTITGPLALSSASTLSLQLNRAAKSTALVSVSGALALGGTLNIASFTSADTGAYTIISAGSVTGTFSPTVTGIGDAYNVSTTVEGAAVKLTIALKGGDEGVIQNYLNVTQATYTGNDAQGGSKVTLTLNGLLDLRTYIRATYPQVRSVYVWYRPEQAAASESDTTINGGRVEIPLTSIPSAGDVMTYDITVPKSKVDAAGNVLFYFSVNVYWWKSSGVAATPPSPMKGNASASLKAPDNPTASVKPNGFTVSADVVTNDGEGIAFALTVSGQNDPDLTPSDATKPRVESVGIWFTRNGSKPALTGTGNTLTTGSVPTSDSVIVVKLTDLRANGSILFFTGPVENSDGDNIYFSIAPLWKMAGVDSIARPLYVTTIILVPKLDVPPPPPNTPNNPVTLTARQSDSRKADVSVTVDKSGEFNEFAATVRVEMSLSSSMSNPINSKSFTIGEIKDDGGYNYTVTDDAFVGAVRQVYYRITVLDEEGVGGGEVKNGSFSVGRTPPTPVTDFRAEPGPGGSMDLYWNPPTTANGIGDINLADVRIYRSDKPISPNADTSALIYVATVSATQTRPTAQVTRLELNQDYYFAAVLIDVVNKSKPSWTLSSQAAVCSGNTGSGNVFDNALGIDSASFDDDAKNFNISVKLKANWTSGYKYGYLVTLGADTVVSSNTETPPSSASKTNDTFKFNTKEINSVVFDTVYTVYVYTIDGQNISRRDSWPVRMGAFTKETVVVAPGGSGTADNGNFKIDAVGWTAGTAPCTTTVIGSITPADNMIAGKGFIAIGSYGYKYTAKAGSDISILGAFKILMKTKAEIPAEYTANDVKLYRWSGEYWEVVYDTKYENGYFTGTAIDSVYAENNKDYTYRLMINTGNSNSGRMPRVYATGYTETVDETKAINESYSITSNIGNCKVSLLYGRANGEAVLSAAKPTFSKEKGESRNVSFTISDSVVQISANSGILAFIVVDDGSTKDTLNYSHKIRSLSSTGFSVVPALRKWLPFAAQVELDNRDVKTTLRQLFYQDGDEFATDSTLFLLYRWYETADNKSKNNKWVEFNGSNDSAFKMEPWRLMWLKTSEAKPLVFGSAVSVSLRDTVKIVLPPKQWTDFVMPFRFNVCLGDILDATKAGAKNSAVPPIEFYRWVEPENNKKKQYITDWLVLATVDSSVELRGGDDPFTIYNDNNVTDTLRIPPRPASMSRYNKANKRGLAKTAAYAQETGGAWHYTLRASADDATLPSVLIGYNAVERAFAVPPSFANESVVLVDDSGAEIGHHFGPSIVSGHTYKLRFYNDGRQRAVFTFSAQPSANAPYNARITFVRASTSEILGGRSEQSISVAAMSHEDVFMIIGNSGYRAKAATVTAGAKFGVDRISVNRAARSARITYYVPESGVERVEASIYDIKGRQVWKNIQAAKPAAWNTMEWNGRGARVGGTSTGLYILRVKAIGPNGIAAGIDHKRIMFAR